MTRARLPAVHRDPILWLAMLLVGAMGAALGMLSYRGYNSSMLDLGAMAQAMPRRGWNSGCRSLWVPLAFTDTRGPTATRLEPAGRPPVTSRIPHRSASARQRRRHSSGVLGLSLTSSTSTSRRRATWWTGAPRRPPM